MSEVWGGEEHEAAQSSLVKGIDCIHNTALVVDATKQRTTETICQVFLSFLFLF